MAIYITNIYYVRIVTFSTKTTVQLYYYQITLFCCVLIQRGQRGCNVQENEMKEGDNYSRENLLHLEIFSLSKIENNFTFSFDSKSLGQNELSLSFFLSTNVSSRLVKCCLDS